MSQAGQMRGFDLDPDAGHSEKFEYGSVALCDFYGRI
jgi:hypothetical protein